MKTKCWLWKGCTQKGYGIFKVNNKHYRVHRFMWEITHGPIKNGLYVCHKCDVRNCINPSHLFLGTAEDNLKDCMSKGRFRVASGKYHGTKTRPERVARGSSHGISKLTEEQVINIRKLYKSGRYTHKSIATLYKVTEGLIQQIINRKIWVHV